MRMSRPRPTPATMVVARRAAAREEVVYSRSTAATANQATAMGQRMTSKPPGAGVEPVALAAGEDEDHEAERVERHGGDGSRSAGAHATSSPVAPHRRPACRTGLR